MTAPDREAEALIDYLCEEAEHEVECAGEFTELAKQLRALEVTARRLARESITNKPPTDAEALLSEAVKAGMLEGASVCDCRDREKDDSMYLVGCIDASQANAKRIRALASDPETIASIVAQVKEGTSNAEENQ